MDIKRLSKHFLRFRDKNVKRHLSEMASLQYARDSYNSFETKSTAISHIILNRILSHKRIAFYNLSQDLDKRLKLTKDLVSYIKRNFDNIILEYHEEHPGQKFSHQNEFILQLDSKFTLCIQYNGHIKFDLYYSDEQDLNNLVSYILKLEKKYQDVLVRTEQYINFLIQKDNRLGIEPFELKHIEVDIDTQYPDDFPAIDTLVRDNINNLDKTGLYLLYGQPGCGKTSYVQYITNKIQRKVVFIPPSMFNSLGTPAFLNFLYENRGCTLIIEDAENLLRDRKLYQGNDCSFLLNITDGFISKILGMQVICTFNCDLSEIDEALLRKGRLICSYEFKKLDETKSKSLIKRLHDLDVDVEEPMTLADIYNLDQNQINNLKKTKTKIGF